MQELSTPFEYKMELTADGSPTLRLPPTWEPMHSLNGAFTETLYIYAPTVALALKCDSQPRILSVGLGLGYNEILVASEALLQPQTNIFIDSYESVAPLRTYFENWILGKTTELNFIYDMILSLYSQKYLLTADSIRDQLKILLTNEQLKLHGALTPETSFEKSHGILFDAFSSKSSPELWTEEFLNLFFKNAPANKCHLSTYASKGTFHRALKTHGFSAEKKLGFGIKRESTFAFRL